MTVNDKLLKTPKNPGVYFFKNKNDQIIYIGKAKILKNRIRSYFVKKGKHPSAKVNIMVNHIVDVDWIVVRDEKEALITEANMIKEHRPKYNVLLKDDKTFPYIKITNEPYPKIEIIRSKNLKDDKNTYLGPFTDVGYLRELFKVIHKTFPLRTCSFFIDSNSIKAKKHSICLDFHIGRCEGPCEGLVATEKYNKMIKDIVDFIKGGNNNILNELKKEMLSASKAKNYEKAAGFRDQINAVESFSKRQKKILHDFENQDVLSVDYEKNYGVGVLFRIRNGHLISIEKFNLLLRGDDKSDIIEQFFLQYYSATYDFPDTILIEKQIDRLDEYSKWISDKKDKVVKIEIPIKGEKKKLVDLCSKNASLYLKEITIKKIKRKENIHGTILQLQEDLGMSIAPLRIEAFDNSNINGKPRKSEYRKFNIKTVKGIDDFASMHEIVTRKYTRALKEGTSLPDLIVIDGGKGQLSAAKSALSSLGLGYIDVIGLAKRLEEVYKPNLSDPQNISKTSPGLYLLRSIRDEVHRYAISFHKQRRGKDMTASIFKDIKGLGLKRLQMLWLEFKSIDDIKKTTVDKIIKKTNIPKPIAKQIIKKAKSLD